MNWEETSELMKDLIKVREKDEELSIILIEHDMRVIKEIAHRSRGAELWGKDLEGTFEEASRDKKVRQAYLGKGNEVLQVNGINTRYENVQVLFDVSLNIEKDEIVCLLGSNGAGKSTTLKTIIGLAQSPTGASILRSKELIR
jgi:ABC-type branched-subunit amino acid transport system ATPase component